ncbi:quinone oxidoreductase PIG3-like [Fagus crenata]
MKAIVISSPGGPEVLQLQEVEEPELKDDEVLIKVEASALNRADTFQRTGMFLPPKGASPYIGVECSGTIQAVGKTVSSWKIGDQVCALLNGGGYAEKVAVSAGQVLPVPHGVSLKDAASLPEVACTVWSTVFMKNQLSAGETFLVHGASSGIGTFAIQIAKFRGARVLVTAGSDEKLAFCKNLGADVCINYKTEDFVKRVKEETDGKGVDVILDHIGASYFRQNLESLNFDGRLLVIGSMGGSVTEVDLRALISKRITVQGTKLRNRSAENKAVIISEVEKNVWPAIEERWVKPVIYKYFPLSDAAEAHQLMENSSHIGKILLVP